VTLRDELITPFNAFSVFSFILLAGVALLVHNTKLPTIGLAMASAVLGFLLIISFFVWTLSEGEEGD
jgi:uncharacterized membrane protein